MSELTMATVVAVIVAVAAQTAEPQKTVEDNIADDPVVDHANALG